MNLRALLRAASILAAFCTIEARPAATEMQTAPQSPPPLPVSSTAPYEERVAAAKSAKVMTSILGIELGSSLERAHRKLDKLAAPDHPPKEEKEGEDRDEGERRVLWQFAKTDYAFFFVKTDGHENIIYVSGFLRPGKEIPFDKIGETKKAPVQDVNTIAWDVLRDGRPLFRVVATGSDRKARSVMIFVVQRPRGVESKPARS